MEKEIKSERTKSVCVCVGGGYKREKERERERCNGYGDLFISLKQCFSTGVPQAPSKCADKFFVPYYSYSFMKIKLFLKYYTFF
jgi:hypothetical protein